MHCLWGLQDKKLLFEMKGGTSLSKGWRCIERFSEDIDIRFDPPPGLNTRGEEKKHIEARLTFFDNLVQDIHIDGISVERDRTFDDEKARNGGIRLNYHSHFTPKVEGLKSGVLLEVGFDTTAPNTPHNITSWTIDKAIEVGLDVTENRASSVKCFNPEYTFVDKLQTICRRYRQFRDRKDPEKDRPKEFLRHYYDLFKLLDLDRVKSFIGTKEYREYKETRVRPNGQDAAIFQSGEAFKLNDDKTLELFAQDFEAVKKLIWVSIPTFQAVIERIRTKASSF